MFCVKPVKGPEPNVGQLPIRENVQAFMIYPGRLSPGYLGTNLNAHSLIPLSINQPHGKAETSKFCPHSLPDLESS